jgi:hypothetical protein
MKKLLIRLLVGIAGFVVTLILFVAAVYVVTRFFIDDLLVSVGAVIVFVVVACTFLVIHGLQNVMEGIEFAIGALQKGRNDNQSTETGDTSEDE